MSDTTFPRVTELPFPYPTGSYEEELEDGTVWTNIESPSDADMARYEEALALEPGDTHVRRHYMYGLNHRDRLGEAIEQAREVFRTEPDETGLMAQWLYQAGEVQEARTHFRALLCTPPERGAELLAALNRRNFATALTTAGQRDEAAHELRTAIALTEVAVSDGRIGPRLMGELTQQLETLSSPGSKAP